MHAGLRPGNAAHTYRLQLTFIALVGSRRGKSDCCAVIFLLFLPALPASWLLAEQPRATGSSVSSMKGMQSLTLQIAVSSSDSFTCHLSPRRSSLALRGAVGPDVPRVVDALPVGA